MLVVGAAMAVFAGSSAVAVGAGPQDRRPLTKADSDAGAVVRSTGGRNAAVATDGHRLAAQPRPSTTTPASRVEATADRATPSAPRGAVDRAPAGLPPGGPDVLYAPP